MPPQNRIGGGSYQSCERAGKKSRIGIQERAVRAVYQIFVAAWGGLDAVVERLAHIEALGCDAVYLTPIFQAPSPHKYDTADYRVVDEGFGGEAAFERLAAALRERHLPLILDGVFNHVGDQHLWAREKRFLRGTVWRGHSSLPELDLGDAALREELFGDGGVVAHWTRRGVGGWRLDCANDLGPEICALARAAAEKAGAGAGVIGELMGYPDEGSGVDGVMNYWLRSCALQLATGGPAAQVQYALDRLAQEISPALLARSWNVVSSHDTPRLATLLDADGARQALALAVAYPGVPMIYYGEEIGMRGGADPANRAPMVWDPSQWDSAWLEWVKKLLHLREPALAGGRYLGMPQPGTDLVCFARATTRPEETVIFVANGAAERRTAKIFVPLPWMHDALPLKDLLGGDGARMAAGTIELTLPARGVMLLKPEDDHPSGYRFWK
jgi:alpha-glucosidase